MVVLFLNDCNRHEYNNPLATQVEIYYSGDLDNLMGEMETLEFNQIGVMNRGGNYKNILDDLYSKFRIHSEVISHGKRDDYNLDQFDRKYNLISGNY